MTGATEWAEVLRPEARPLDFGVLDEQQKDAFARIVALLDAATRDAARAAARSAREDVRTSTPTAAGGPYLEPQRTSRNILVSGERGTGKTTLMLSLARALNPDAGVPRDETVPEELGVRIRELHRRLMWLETLDMEPIASEANLLGAVLARVESAAGAALLGDEEPKEAVSLLYPSARVHDVSRELARLQTSVALTFGGNLTERAGSLDPDTYAVESRRAERERLGLDRRFADVLAGLSAALAGTADRTAPVFVLPVDDADLNVTECVPLLKLLRAVSSPHLVVLLAADLRLLSMILELWYQGQLATLSRPVPLTECQTRQATDLATNALRKHLPPAQRVVLGFVDPVRALSLRPAGPARPALGQVLGRVVLPPDTVTLVLDAHFGRYMESAVSELRTTRPGWPPPGPRMEADEVVARLRAYSWTGVLRQTMRRLIDLYQDSAAYPARADDTGHSPEDTPVVQLALERAGFGGERPNDPNSLIVGGRTGEVSLVGGSTDVPPIGLRRWHGWKISASYPPLSSTEGPTVIGALEVVGDRSDGLAYSFSGPDMPLIRHTRWASHPADVEVGWPWVSHSTVWANERALAWLARAEQAWPDQTVDRYFGSWVAVMTAQLFDAPDGDQAFDTPTRELDHDWGALAGRLAELGNGKRDGLTDAWLTAAGLLCTPEMGMIAPDAVPAWMTPERAGEVQRLREQRRTALPEPLRHWVEDWRPAPFGDPAEPDGPDEPPQSAKSASRRRTPAKKTTPPPRGDP